MPSKKGTGYSDKSTDCADYTEWDSEWFDPPRPQGFTKQACPNEVLHCRRVVLQKPIEYVQVILRSPVRAAHTSMVDRHDNVPLNTCASWAKSTRSVSQSG
jgi:hypothetical protein